MKLYEIAEKPGSYIGWKFNQESVDRIMKYAKDCKLEYPSKPSKIHITVLFSRKYCENLIPKGKFNTLLPVEIHKLEIFGPDEKGERFLVIRLKNKEIMERNKELMDRYNVVSDYGEYKPHVTLGYQIKEDFDIGALPDVKNIGRLFVQEEYFNPLKKRGEFNPAAKKKTY